MDSLPQTIFKTIVNVDLKGYTFPARILQDQLSSVAVGLLDQQIQRLVDDGLRSIGSRRPEVVLKTTGDGATLAFDAAADAHRFGVALHHATHQHNAGKGQDAQRWFRVGIATGEVCRYETDHGPELAGTVRIDAVRLETAGEPGGILIDQETFRKLPCDLEGLYAPMESVIGKHGERLAAYSHMVLDRESRPAIRLSGPALDETVRGWMKNSNLTASFLTSLDDAFVAGLALPAPVRDSSVSRIRITGTAAKRLVFIGSHKEARRIIIDFLLESSVSARRRKDPTERAWTYYALGQLGGRRAVQALLVGANEEKGMAGKAAREALAAFESPDLQIK